MGNMVTKFKVFEIPRNYGACALELDELAAEGWMFLSMNEYQIVMTRDEPVEEEPEMITG
jgi:hypothetical protein